MRVYSSKRINGRGLVVTVEARPEDIRPGFIVTNGKSFWKVEFVELDRHLIFGVKSSSGFVGLGLSLIFGRGGDPEEDEVLQRFVGTGVERGRGAVG